MGSRIAALGDLTGDGVPDLVVGAPRYPANVSASNIGKVFVLSGTDGATIFELTGPSVPGAYFGGTVAGPGDATGDGVPDFLVGSYWLGEARLYSGATGSLVYSIYVASGAGVGAPGDTNWDGVPDLLVGAPLVGNGVGHLYSGLDASLLQSMPPVPSPGCDLLGATLAGIGDVDGDGAGDVVLGAPEYTAGLCQIFPGYANVYSGGTGALLATLSGPIAPSAQFGFAVTGLGDVTGDGIPDLAVKDAGGMGPWATVAGIWVFSGAGFGLAAFVPDAIGEALGFSLAGAGDIDGDGVPDLLAGAPAAGPATTNYAGRAVVLSGSDWSEILALSPPAGEYLQMGFAVSAAGDVDSDGFPDLATGAIGLPPFPVSKVRVYSGCPIGVSAFGSSCAGGSGAVPRIGATHAPRIGTTFKINLSETAPGMPALLMLGFSNAAWWGLPLPFDLAGVGLPGCSLAVSPDFVLGYATSAWGPGKGRAIAPMTLPSDAALVGASFYAQWYVVDPGPAPIPGGMTRGLSIVLQP